MTDRWMILLALLCCTILAACAQSAFARPLPQRHAPLASDFDLSRHDGQEDEGNAYRVSQEGESRRFRKGDLGPYLTYNPVNGGPTLEFGALGAGRKGTPGLAHIGMDWRF